MPNPRYTSSDAYRQLLASAARRWLATRFIEGDSVTDIDRLVDLLDVLLTNPQVGDGLQYDGSKWINKQKAVSCVLVQNALLDVRRLGAHAIIWDGLKDNIWDYNPLSAIPDGLGLDFSFDGLDPSGVTCTESGIWSFDIMETFTGPDASFKGYFGQTFDGIHDPIDGVHGPNNSITRNKIVALPELAVADFLVGTEVLPVSDPYYVITSVVVTRLA